MSIFFIFSLYTIAQSVSEKPFSKSDTLRGTITPERAWWDLLHYAIYIQPNIPQKSVEGNVAIQFKAIQPGKILQIDLQQPLIIDSVLEVGNKQQFNSLSFKRTGNIALINFNHTIVTGKKATIIVYYHGKPREAVRPPWDGGVSWKNDQQGNPFVATSCQGLGASVWWPCKDHQADEPNDGLSISVRIPDTLVEVSNGQLKKVITHTDHTKTWTWEVKNPINNYGVSMNIGKYERIKDTFNGEAGVLNLNYYILSAHKDSALQQLKQIKQMLSCFEYWMGKYPFYEDGYKLVEVPYLGMEHQSNVAYGNKFKNGYLGRDLSGTGWGLNWDFIIIHESGHEWFGNNITSKDIADMWIHEGFTNYTETLFTQWLNGKEAANEYNYGSRKNILNDKPIIAPFGVNAMGSGDMYSKASAMIHSIRMGMNDDIQFRKLLRAMNSNFYHKTVTTEDVEQLISKYTGYPVKQIFNQYLRNTTIPILEYYLAADKKMLNYRYTNAIDGFNMPLIIACGNTFKKIVPKNNEWQQLQLTIEEATALQISNIEKYFYLQLKERKELVIKAY